MDKYNMQKEIWKDIKDYEGIYKISNTGKIWSCKRKIEMKQKLSKGYLLIGLYKEGIQKTFSVHRLVSKAFIENPLDKKEVNHIDENKINNKASNLEWCTSKENANHGTRNKRISEWVLNNGNLTIKSVAMLDKQTGVVLAEFETINDAYRHLGKNINGNISSVCKGKYNSIYGYKWKYI